MVQSPCRSLTICFHVTVVLIAGVLPARVEDKGSTESKPLPNDEMLEDWDSSFPSFVALYANMTLSQLPGKYNFEVEGQKRGWKSGPGYKGIALDPYYDNMPDKMIAQELEQAKKDAANRNKNEIKAEINNLKDVMRKKFTIFRKVHDAVSKKDRSNERKEVFTEDDDSVKSVDMESDDVWSCNVKPLKSDEANHNFIFTVLIHQSSSGAVAVDPNKVSEKEDGSGWLESNGGEIAFTKYVYDVQGFQEDHSVSDKLSFGIRFAVRSRKTEEGFRIQFKDLLDSSGDATGSGTYNERWTGKANFSWFPELREVTLVHFADLTEKEKLGFSNPDANLTYVPSAQLDDEVDG